MMVTASFTTCVALSTCLYFMCLSVLIGLNVSSLFARGGLLNQRGLQFDNVRDARKFSVHKAGFLTPYEGFVTRFSEELTMGKHFSAKGSFSSICGSPFEYFRLLCTRYGINYDKTRSSVEKSTTWNTITPNEKLSDQVNVHGSEGLNVQNGSLLSRIHSPHDLKGLSLEQLQELVKELRWDVVHAVSRTGGHLSASLGVVELTVALHHIFDTPNDKLIWDVSHQAYPHKILTGRREMMTTMRQRQGLSGFCKRAESVYDPFGAGHSSTSLSAAQGFAEAMKAQGSGKNLCISVIGDGGITGGMAYEAMNYIGHLKSKVLVILNDNEQVSLPTGTNSAAGTGPAGALASYTARLLTSRGFQNFRRMAKSLTKLLPNYLRETATKIDEYSRGIITGGTLFEELGFYYVGPVDGHDLESLLAILRNIKETALERPILLHVKTKKGYGYSPAMNAADKMHGVVKFDVNTGKQFKKSENPALTSVFAKTLCDIGSKDKSVVAVTAAMPGGTGVERFGKLFPDRTFDVGIAEQHAVTFCGGLAAGGLTPFCCIYSTFLQRGYDQIIHDVVLQELPVRFIVDRAGLVGADGATHQGAYDLAYLGTLPSVVIMSPSNEVELMNMIQTAYEINDMPSVVRYSKSSGYGLDFLNEKFGYNLTQMPETGVGLKIGTGRRVREGRNNSARKVAILSLGTRLADSVAAAEKLESLFDDVGVTVADARFLRPLDIELIRNLAHENDYLVTIEEGAVGGFGDHVLHFMALDGLLDKGSIKVRPLVLPDKFIDHGTQDEQYDEAGLSCPHIVANINSLMRKEGS